LSDCRFLEAVGLSNNNVAAKFTVFLYKLFGIWNVYEYSIWKKIILPWTFQNNLVFPPRVGVIVAGPRVGVVAAGPRVGVVAAGPRVGIIAFGTLLGVVAAGILKIVILSTGNSTGGTTWHKILVLESASYTTKDLTSVTFKHRSDMLQLVKTYLRKTAEMVAFLSMLISLIYQRFRFLFYSSFDFSLSFSSWNWQMFHCDTIICDLLKTQLSFQGIPNTFSNLSTKSSRKWFNKYKYFRLGFIVFLLNSCDKNVMMLSIIDTKHFRIP
jgi:hypothetical protein